MKALDDDLLAEDGAHFLLKSLRPCEGLKKDCLIVCRGAGLSSWVLQRQPQGGSQLLLDGLPRWWGGLGHAWYK